METMKLTECIGGLQELKLDNQKIQKKGLPFIMASVVIWTLILIVQFLHKDVVKTNLCTFICSCYLMPLSFIFSKMIKADIFKKSMNPINKLGFLCTMNQMLYIIIVMWAYNQKPEAMVMLYAMVFGAHLLPFGWIYDSFAYKFISIIDTIGAIIICLKWGVVPMIVFVIIAQIILCVSLFSEVKKL